ncbi:F0F1 ATP synthase subunit A [Caulobacter sp. S45]|uniref:F0F1 ATP synthase subunit A n=1 Tax=Caulobacter sp. S45 TaxID=1641861 RepID=UPI00131CC166|nr:F0F1 ATP synthase subunit A [Caulobacter sp. S45]
MAGPMEQFEIHQVLALPKIAGMDFSITNVTLAMFAAAAAVMLFFAVAARKAIVPSRMQSVGELMFELVDDLSESIIGHEGRRYFPLVFSLFMFIMMMNVLGMFVVIPTATSQLSVTVSLAVLTILVVVFVGFQRNGLGFFKLFAPTGVPLFIMPLIVPIEILSFLIRPLTLSLRLFGNMIGGHVVLNIFGGFVVSLGLLALGGGIASLGILGSGVALGSVVALLALEFVVAFLQAFVFAVLACVYLNDVVNLHSH